MFKLFLYSAILSRAWVKLLLLFSLTIAAQTKQPLFEIDTIFVTAKRYKETTKNVIQPASTISRREIENRTIGDIAKALKYETGLDVRSYSFLKGLSSLSIQGSSSMQVLSLLAGMPLDLPTVGMVDFGLIPTFLLSKAEVIKGPSSGIHGANALAGVVNLLPAVEELKPSLSILYGSNRTFSQRIKGKYFFDKFAFGGGLENFSTRGMRENDDLTSLQAGIIFDYDKFLILASGITFRNMGVPGPVPAKDFIPAGGDSLSSSLSDRQGDTFYFTNLTFDKNFGKTSLNLNTFLNKSLINFYNVVFWDTLRNEYRSSYNQGNFGTNFSLAYDVWESGKISFGGDMKKEFCEVKTDTVWSAERIPVGAFSTFRQKLLGKITGEMSLRYDKLQTKVNLSPSFGILIKPFAGQAFKLYYGRGFRIPTFNDLYFPYSGNPDLKPEFGSGLELGYRIERKSVVSEFNLFSRKAIHLIRWAPENGFWRPKNLDTSLTYGVETKVRIRVLTNLELSSGGILMDGYEIKDKKYSLTVVPKIGFNSEIFYKPTENSEIYLSGIFKGRRRFFYGEKEKILTSYCLINLVARQRVMGIILLEGRAENLLNQNYATTFGTTLNDRDYPGGGRKFSLGLELTK